MAGDETTTGGEETDMLEGVGRGEAREIGIGAEEVKASADVAGAEAGVVEVQTELPEARLVCFRRGSRSSNEAALVRSAGEAGAEAEDEGGEVMDMREADGGDKSASPDIGEVAVDEPVVQPEPAGGSPIEKLGPGGEPWSRCWSVKKVGEDTRLGVINAEVEELAALALMFVKKLRDASESECAAGRRGSSPSKADEVMIE